MTMEKLLCKIFVARQQHTSNRSVMLPSENNGKSLYNEPENKVNFSCTETF